MSDPLDIGTPQATKQRLDALGRLLARMRDRDHIESCSMLEVGSYEGQSALFFSHAAGMTFPQGGKLLCVDPWLPYHSEAQRKAGEVYRRMHSDLSSGNAFARFCQNIKKAHPLVPISFHQGTLISALTTHRSGLGPFDFIYLDGDHTYPMVRSDIIMASTLLREGGVLCGDDLEKLALPEEAEMLRQHQHEDYINGFHPGVSLAVLEIFGSEVWHQHGAWAVRRVGRAFSKEV